MQTELFGVFGDRATFDRFRSERQFDHVVEGSRVTLGFRDVAAGLPNRTTAYRDDGDVVTLWGETYVPESRTPPAEWLLGRYRAVGADAFSGLNGSYLAIADVGDDAVVATDQARTWECYYTDAPGPRVFGTNPETVARTIGSPTLAEGPLREFSHLGVVFDDRTVLEELHRVPFDSLLTASGTGELSRFVYDPHDPSEFDYAAELAERLSSAIERRSGTAGTTGLLLSGGYDSRAILALHPDVDVSYTIGDPESDEMAVARRLADRYDSDHRALQADSRYLNVNEDETRYSHGIKESLHVHQAGYESEMDADRMLHGLHWDTFLRGHFQPNETVSVLGQSIPLDRIESDPDPAETLVDKLGFMDASQRAFEICNSDRDAVDFAHDAVEASFPWASDRYDDINNGIALFGVQNQPTTPFRMHLADRFIESFVAADAELLEWHLKTPPEHRTTETFVEALRMLDGDLVTPRPPDRPHDSHTLNQVEGFLRRQLPVVDAFESPWPDRQAVYRREHLDHELLPLCPDIHQLPPRIKLRVNDLTNWVDSAANDTLLKPPEALCPDRLD